MLPPEGVRRAPGTQMDRDRTLPASTATIGCDPRTWCGACHAAHASSGARGGWLNPRREVGSQPPRDALGADPGRAARAAPGLLSPSRDRPPPGLPNLTTPT